MQADAFPRTSGASEIFVNLNFSESLCLWLRPQSFFVFSQNRKNCKTYFFELLLGILSDLCETWHVHSSTGPDLKLSKEFCSVKKCANYKQTHFCS